MAIVNKDTLKNWFLRGMKPLSSQFSDWMDSYWHKNEKISTANIDKLDDVLGTKAEYNDLQAHLNDAGNPHRVTAEQLGIDMNVNLSLTTDESTNTINNTHGYGVTLSTASEDDAGLMGADDRVKMTQLFNGSVISYQKDGYGHRHSYLELQDAPSQLQLTASTFLQLKEAVNKLATLGRKGEILITGIIVINENIELSCNGITFVGNGGTIDVEKFPLKIKSPETNVHFTLRNITFFVGKYNGPNPVVSDSHTAIEYTGEWSSCILENVTFINLYCDANPRDTLVVVVEESTGVKFYLNNTTVIAENFPANFKLSFNTANVRIVNSQSLNSQPLCLKIPTSSSGSIQTDVSSYLEQVPANVTVTNLSPFFSASPIGGYIPSPAPSQKESYYALNALGEWIDVRTLPANGGNADTLEGIAASSFLRKDLPTPQQVSGYVDFTSGAGSTSDRRLKTDIERLTGCDELLNEINGYRFTLRNNGKRSMGVIAQEIQDVLPELVHEDEKGFLSVEYFPLIGILIESAKERAKECQFLAGQIASLHSRIEQMQKKDGQS